MYRTFGASEPGQALPDERPKTSTTRALVGVSVIVSLGLILGLASSSTHHQGGNLMSSLLSTGSKAAKSKPTFKVTVTGEYAGDEVGKRYDFVRSERVVEPYRKTEIKISPSDPDVEITGCAWSFENTDGAGGVFPDSSIIKIDESITTSDADQTTVCSTQVEFHSPGDYKFTVMVKTENGNILELDEKLQSYYVRREIHTLSDLDWNRFLDTYLILSKTSDSEGKAQYGSYYSSLSTLAAIHLDNAGRKPYDRIHEGLGLLTQHIALSNYFERAMQSVTPAFSLPYWDYTIESAMVLANAENGDGRKADWSHIVYEGLFDEKYFGNTGHEHVAWHAIENGRFAYQTVAHNASAEVNSPYGYLRAPWNLNPSPYVTRYHEMCGSKPYWAYVWPQCDSHYKAVYNTPSWYEISWDLGIAPHGPVHVWLGGIGGGCLTWSTDEYPLSLLDDTELDDIKQMLFAMLKEAFRYSMIKFPSTCSLDDLTTEDMLRMVDGKPREEHADCKWECRLEQPDAVEAFVQTITDVAKVSLDGFNKQEKEDIVKKVFCSESFWPGDHLESASAFEASFWPIHPTLDRLIQFKRMVNDFDDGLAVWWDPGDKEGSTYCEVSGVSCYGHHPGDMTAFETIVKEHGVYQMKYLTNEEVLNVVNPAGDYAAHYIYENFEWPHCEIQGLKFSKK